MQPKPLDPNPPMPAVNPEDVQAVWQLMNKVNTELAQSSDAARNEGGAPGVGIAASIIAGVCSPGAEVLAVFFRAALIPLMQRQGLLSPWQQGSDLSPVVFQVAATMPMGGLEGFDPGDFLAKLREAS